MGVPLLIHQPSYSILNRWIENDGTMNTCDELGVGIIAYGALGHGLLSGKHSRNVGSIDGGRALPEHHQNPKAVEAANKVGTLAQARGQTPAQLALAWCLRKQVVGMVNLTAKRRADYAAYFVGPALAIFAHRFIAAARNLR